MFEGSDSNTEFEVRRSLIQKFGTSGIESVLKSPKLEKEVIRIKEEMENHLGGIIRKVIKTIKKGEYSRKEAEELLRQYADPPHPVWREAARRRYGLSHWHSCSARPGWVLHELLNRMIDRGDVEGPLLEFDMDLLNPADAQEDANDKDVRDVSLKLAELISQGHACFSDSLELEGFDMATRTKAAPKKTVKAKPAATKKKAAPKAAPKAVDDDDDEDEDEDEVEEATAPKRKPRGRPKKNPDPPPDDEDEDEDTLDPDDEDEDEEDEDEGGDGDDEEEEDDDEEDEDEEDEEDEDEDDEEDEGDEEEKPKATVKRGRGRPPKDAPKEEAAPKKRGRPPKAKAEEAPATSATDLGPVVETLDAMKAQLDQLETLVCFLLRSTVPGSKGKTVVPTDDGGHAKKLRAGPTMALYYKKDKDPQ